eukprot:6368731-Amphidinium_carterae.1
MGGKTEPAISRDAMEKTGYRAQQKKQTRLLKESEGPSCSVDECLELLLSSDTGSFSLATSGSG